MVIYIRICKKKKREFPRQKKKRTIKNQSINHLLVAGQPTHPCSMGSCSCDGRNPWFGENSQRSRWWELTIDI